MGTLGSVSELGIGRLWNHALAGTGCKICVSLLMELLTNNRHQTILIVKWALNDMPRHNSVRNSLIEVLHSLEPANAR